MKTIDVWHDTTSDCDKPVWCVSLVENREELSCLRTFKSRDKAVKWGRLTARERGLALRECDAMGRTSEIATKTVYGQCDEHGRCYGFEADCDIGSFGDGLEGETVTLPDGSAGTVTKVYSYIQTGGSGVSNYVDVAIDVDAD